MRLNLKVRMKNKMFWLAFIPAVLFLVQSVLALFGVQMNFETVDSQLKEVVVAAFSVLTLLGVVNDPTTSGISDSARAMTYDKPFKV